MRVKPIVFGIVTVTLFMGIILGAQAIGFWSVSGKVDSSGQAINPDAVNVETIKRWMTLGQITEVYGVTLDQIKARYSLPSDVSADTAIKDLESDTFETDALREWLSGQTTPDSQPAATRETAVKPTVAATLVTSLITPVETASYVATEMTITGKTTFRQLLDWGMKQAVIEQIIGTPLPEPNQVIKDFLTGQGLEFAEYKTALQAELDKLK